MARMKPGRPTRSLPEHMNIPRPYASAPPDRIAALLSAYRGAGRASAEACGAVAGVAAEAGAPSRVLATAQAAVAAGGQRPGETGRTTRPWPVSRIGPFERTLRDLGIDRPGLLHQGQVIDRAGELLIAEATEGLAQKRRRTDAAELDRSSGTTELVNHVLASGDLRATARARATLQREREPEP
jgi:hypothetical protein